MQDDRGEARCPAVRLSSSQRTSEVYLGTSIAGASVLMRYRAGYTVPVHVKVRFQRVGVSRAGAALA